MPIEIEQLPEEPIIIATSQESLDPGSDIPAMFAEFTRLRLAIEGDVVLILDLRSARAAFSQVMIALAEASRGIRAGKAAGIDRPPIVIFIGSGVLTELASKALAQRQYGGVEGRLCASREEALALAHEILAAKKGK